MEKDIQLDRAAAQVQAVLRGDIRAPYVKAFFDEATFTASYIVHDPATKTAAIIDSVLDFDQPSGRTSCKSADALIAYVKEQGLTVEWLLETHAHADHLSAAPYLQEKLGGKLVIGAEIVTVQNVFGKIFNEGTRFARDGSQFDLLLKDGDTLSIGEIPLIALHVPGHTPADLAYQVEGLGIFIGDTLFMPDVGTARCDFPGGNASTLYRSIKKLLAFPGGTRLYLCHDYPPEGRDRQCCCTVAEQRADNIHVRDGTSEDEFVAMRTARDKTLDMPVLILPAIQINIRAGQCPPPEDNGVRYLKIPINQF